LGINGTTTSSDEHYNLFQMKHVTEHSEIQEYVNYITAECYKILGPKKSNRTHMIDGISNGGGLTFVS